MISLLPLLPFSAAIGIMLLPKEQERSIKDISLVTVWATFFLTLYFFLRFNPAQSGYQFVMQREWLPSLGISYAAGLDGINLTLCLLHALVSLAATIMACSVKLRAKEYFFFLMILVGAIFGVFTTLDTFFLYLFYELTLIPLYPMIGIWGSKNKEYGAMQLTLYITTGAVLALFGIFLLYKELGSHAFNLIALRETLQAAPISLSAQKLIAPFLLIGFGVIASLWPLHSWSPIGYAAAPTSVSMLHAGVLKKMGPYLILRLALTLVPDGVSEWSHYLAALAGIGIIYAGYAAIKQNDLKYMVGFSSVSHMGYVLLGIAAMTADSLSGAVVLMFSHGIMAACTFALIGFIYEQAHTRGIKDFGGLGKKIPFVSICFIMASLASLGLPGFSNFVAELLVFIGSWQKFPVWVALAVFGILITAFYLLRAVQHVFYGPYNPKWNDLKDAKTLAEKFPFLLLLGALMLFGFWPQGLLRIIRPAVEALIK